MSGGAIRYIGFSVRADGRRYEFSVAGDGPLAAERIFVLGIASACFRPGRLKFQEGPEVSLRKLRSILAAPGTDQMIPLAHVLSDDDVAEFTLSGPAKNKVWTDEQREAARQRFKNRLAAPH